MRFVIACALVLALVPMAQAEEFTQTPEEKIQGLEYQHELNMNTIFFLNSLIDQYDKECGRIPTAPRCINLWQRLMKERKHWCPA